MDPNGKETNLNRHSSAEVCNNKGDSDDYFQHEYDEHTNKRGRTCWYGKINIIALRNFGCVS
jgi:hypothetical protein